MSFIGGSSGPIASAFVEVTARTEGAIADILAMVRALAVVDEAAQAAGEGIERAFREAARSADRSLRSIGGAGAFAGIEAESAAAGAAIGENTSKGAALGSAAFGILKTSVIAMGTALAAGGAAMTIFGLKSAASLEQTQTSFKALLGSAEEADKFIRQMQDFAAKTPFEFAGLANNAKSLLATAGALKLTRDQIIPTIETIGDLTAVLGAPPESIDRIILAFSQMASKGKASTEELMQIAEALPGFPVWDAMAKGLGISTKALQEQVQKGLIPADVATQALLKGMKEFPGAAGAMAAQSQTLLGLFSTFKDTISITLTDAFQPLVENVKTALSPLTEVIGNVLKNIAPQVTTVATTIFNALQPIIETVGPGVADAFKGIGEAFQGLAPVVGTVGKALGAAFSALGTIVAPLGKALAPLLEVIAKLVTALLPPLATVIATVVRAITPFIEAVSKVAGRLIDLLAPVLIRIADALSRTLGPAITRVAEILGDTLIRVLEILAPHLDEIVNLLADQLIVTLEALAPVLPDLVLAFGELAIALTQLIVALLPILPVLIQLATLFTTHISVPVIIGIARAITILAGAFTLIASAIAFILTPLSTFKDSFNSIGSNVQIISDTITNVFRPAIDGLRINVIEPFTGLLENRLLPRLNELKDTAFTGISNAISTILKPIWDDLRINVVDPFTGLIENRLIPKLTELKDTTLTGLATTISTVVKPAMDDWKINTLDPLVTMVEGRILNAFQSVLNKFHEVSDFITVTLKPTLDDLRLNVFEPIANVIQNDLKPALDTLGGAALAVWSILAFQLTPVVDILKGAFSALAGMLSGVTVPSFDGASGAGSGLHTVMAFLLIPAAGALRLALIGVDGAAAAAKAGIFLLNLGLQGLQLGFQGVMAMVGLAIGAFNSIVGAVNNVRNAISSLIGDIGRALGQVGNLITGLKNMTSFPVPHIPSIPGFKTGGIIDRDQVALLHAPEVVIPMNDPRRAAALLNESGVLDSLRRPQGTGAISSSSAPVSGVNIDRLTVTINGDATPEQAHAAGSALISGMEEMVRRRQIALSVRTV